MSNVSLYILGAVLVAAALGFAAHLLGLGTEWIAIVSLLTLGFGVMGAVKAGRHKETPE